MIKYTIKQNGISRAYSSNINKKKLVINSNKFKGLEPKALSCVELEKEKSHDSINKVEEHLSSSINATNFIFNTGKLKSKLLDVQTSNKSSVIPTIIQDLRSIYKLNRIGSKYNKRRKRGKFNNQQREINIFNNRKEYNQDLMLLLNCYKFSLLDTKIKENQQLDFLWQSKIFIKLLQQHPILLDHTINCLLTSSSSNLKKDSLIDYLTRIWVGYFDYINQYEYKSNLGKWQGIKVQLSGRVGYKKMGRAKKYSSFWGSLKNASARLPLQYSYSQLHTRYGVIGVKVFIR